MGYLNLGDGDVPVPNQSAKTARMTVTHARIESSERMAAKDQFVRIPKHDRFQLFIAGFASHALHDREISFHELRVARKSEKLNLPVQLSSRCGSVAFAMIFLRPLLLRRPHPSKIAHCPRRGKPKVSLESVM
jgi:hypothetical protein